MERSGMVIDTGVFIQHLRATIKERTVLYNLPTDQELCVSSVTVYELYMGATDPQKQGHVATLLNGLKVLPFDDAVAKQAATIFHELKKVNQLIEFRDIFIAATAKTNQLPIVTLNKKHFQRIQGLQLVS